MGGQKVNILDFNAFVCTTEGKAMANRIREARRQQLAHEAARADALDTLADRHYRRARRLRLIAGLRRARSLEVL